MKGFIKNVNGDVSNFEYENYVLPHMEKFDKYMVDSIIPDICAFYIASGYNDGHLFENSLKTFINCVLDTINYEFKYYDQVKESVKRILEEKYWLVTINEDPLEFR